MWALRTGGTFLAGLRACWGSMELPV
jgi:hypothetical protein